MSLIGFLELGFLFSYIIILFLLLIRWKNSFSFVIKRILLILISLSIFHSFSNTLEWFYITDVLVPYEDYVQILEPIFLFFFFITYIQEATEKNRRDSEKKYRHLFETSPYFIGLIDTKGVLIDCNDVANEILSIHTKSDIIGKNITEIFSLNEKNKYLITKFEKLIKNILEGGGTNREPFDFQLFRSIGGYLWLNIEGTLIEIEKQKLIQFIVQDITERKHVVEKLKYSEKKYKNIFENTGTATLIVEEDTTISLVNRQFEELSGYSREEIEWKKNWIEFVFKEDLERMKEIHYSRRKDPESTLKKYEFRFINKEGNIRDILIVVDMIPGTNKSLASLLDITERKIIESKLKESKEKYRYLFDNAQVGLYWSRISDGKILECNDTFAKLFGYDTREECLESYVTTEHHIGPNTRSEILEEIRDNKEVKNHEILVTKRDGTPIWLSIAARIFEKENRIEGAAIDITERKIAEEKLLESEKKYREAYNRAELYKDIFAHDINNILQSILSGMQVSELILDNPEQLENLKINGQIIKNQVIRGAKLISNVRKLSQLEEPNQNLDKIEILKVLKKVISVVKKSYEKDKNLDIRIDSLDENLFIKANDFLEDVFDNLLINAIQHNRKLIIEIVIKISREQQSSINYVKIEFQDNGFGIANSMKEKIFKRAYKKEEISLGMGLGLSLVQGIIETYKGKIWVEDRVKGARSKGSNFVLLIPEVD